MATMMQQQAPNHHKRLSSSSSSDFELDLILDTENNMLIGNQIIHLPSKPESREDDDSISGLSFKSSSSRSSAIISTTGPSHEEVPRGRSSSFNDERKKLQPVYPPVSMYRNKSMHSTPSLKKIKASASSLIALPWDFMPPRHAFRVASSSSSDKELVRLEPMDVICGRGYSSSTVDHPGNRYYQELIRAQEAAYLCGRRRDKRDIGLKIVKAIRNQGGRFLLPVLNAPESKSLSGQHYIMEDGWFQVLSEQKAYEKACQSLRERAPALRRKALQASSFTSMGMEM